MYMSRMIIANMSKATLKIKRYGIMGKKKTARISTAQKLISLIVPSKSKRNKKIMGTGRSGVKSVNVEMGAELIPCASRTSFWHERISLKIKNVMNWPMPGKSEPTTASLGEKRVSENLQMLFKIW